MTGNDFIKRKLSWAKTTDPLHPFRAQVDGHTLTVRLGDFPEESMYTLLVDGQSIVEFDDWPKSWTRPG
ncbi:hypothetical protein [Pyxidicoccus xibeiensis]|uniref:hypothetical protein n=1 Tax=Pyxidicoccus xibeiensis TaxID=2906759 RepID=UPI0020A7F9AE|nr:hypothetical protein [Pyxidicoccus xibeiensis]MCP3141517.1 hypothetical protein [Pyxidicoccus xibeiensis]